MIPLLHDFDGETVLVFGGGRVGARKARRFAREADVVVVSPAFVDDDERAETGSTSTESGADDPFGGAERVRASPSPADVPEWFDRTDPALAVAATNDGALNDAVAETARERGVLVNRADRAGERDPGSVVVPATIRDDPVVASIATGGRSPALSRHLRERLETELENAGAMAELTAGIRRDLKDGDVAPDRRREAVRAVVRSTAVWKALDSRNANPRQVAADVIADVTNSDVADRTGETP